LEKLVYHPIRLNTADQTILHRYSDDLGKSYDFVINQVWNFWDTMRADMNNLPCYMNRHILRRYCRKERHANKCHHFCAVYDEPS